MRMKGVSGNTTECIKKMYDTKFRVKFESDKVMHFVKQRREVTQGCSFSIYLFNTFTNDINFTSKSNAHAPEVRCRSQGCVWTT
jgi:hypothetical protein